MTKSQKTNYIKLSIFLLFVAICSMFIAQVPNFNVKTLAEQMASNQIEITNSDFNYSTTTSLQSTPNGWSKTGSSSGVSGVICVNEESFSKRASSYALSSTENPDKPFTVQSVPLDDYVLMINAKESTDKTESPNHLGYKSNTINLEPYSYYKLSVWTLTQNNAKASIYLSGLSDDTQNMSFEEYTANVWTEYRFYIATGINEESVNIELWLGSQTKDSLNAVFFDHIVMNQISGNYFYDEAEKYLSETPENQEIFLARKNIIDLREYETNVIENANFETSNFNGWKIVDYMKQGSDAQIVSVNNRASMESLGIEYLGSDLSAQNNYALVLYSTGKDKVSLGYESSSFKVLPYETYKITVWAKLSSDFSGNASIVLSEGNDVSNFYGEEYSDFYSPVSETLKISSNTTNSLTNNYTPYNLYIKGHELFETSFTIQLWLGTSDEGATGSVIFDNISFEKISWEQFKNAETTNSISLSPTTISGDLSVANGTFNSAEDLNKNFTYPVTPSDWSHSAENTNKSMYGIINTYSPIYEANKNFFGNARNPKNPSTSAGDVNSDVNNMLMLYNMEDTYQSVTSAELTTTKETYQKITFDYKTVIQSINNQLMYVYVTDSDGNILFSDEGLYSADWSQYSILIRSTSYASTIKLVIALGSEDNLVSGYLYVDNVRFENDDSMTDDLYQEYVESHKTLDFSITNFNFISSEKKYGMYTPYRYEQKLEAGEQSANGIDIAYGGIIDGRDNEYGIENSENNKEALKYMPAFRANSKATYTLVSKETLTLETEKYYKFSFEVYTRFFGDTEQSDKDEDEKLDYGAIFSLNGIDKSFSPIVSNDTWTTYSMYVEVSNETSVNLRFGILNESEEIQGQAFFDNFVFETIEESEYNQAVEKSKDDATILAVLKSETEVDEDNTTKPNDNESDPSTLLYLIPSLILFVALVIALVAYYMKKVTIKKWERKKASEYDRNSTLYRDVIRKEAEQIRDKKVKEIEAQIDEIKAKISNIEEIHQNNLKQQRETTGNEITKAVERDFKAYAKQHTKLENDIENLKSKIDALNMPEYLLSIQRGIVLEKIRKEKESKEAEIRKQKEQKKLAKKQKNNK